MRTNRLGWLASGLVGLGLVAGLLGLGQSAAPRPVWAAVDLPVYTDALAAGWTNYSWDAAVNFANATPVHGGSAASIAVTLTADWGGLYLSKSTPVSASGYTALHFWIYGAGSAAQTVTVTAVNGDDFAHNTDVSVAPGVWTEMTVAFTALGNPTTLTGLAWQGATAGSGFYVDDITVVGNGQTDAPATATPTPSITSTRTITPTPSPTSTGPTATPTPVTSTPIGGYATLTVNDNADLGGYLGSQFTWLDSQNQPRSAMLVKNDQQDPAGRQGGYMRQYTYNTGSATRVVNGSSDTHPGFGYTVNHYGSTAGASRDVAGTYSAILRGQHHAVHEFKWRLNLGGPVDATVQWFFATGRDYPVWAITFDSSPAGANTVDADTRSPYGDLQWDGGLGSNVEVVGWGDHYKFYSLGSPITLNNGWDYTQPNTVPYVFEYSSAADAEMGLVQTQTYTQHEAGGYWFYSAWGTSDTNGPMPENWNWPYQLNQYELDWGSTSKRLAWGANYGAVGQEHYAAFGEDPDTGISQVGYPYQSYSVFIVLDRHSRNAVAGQVTEIETVQNTTLAASTGSVVTSGPAGLARADTVTYSPAGYNPIYSTWEVRANASQQAVFNLNVGSGTLLNPVFVIRNYTLAAWPQSVSINGVPKVADVDYFASLDPAQHALWLTLKGSFSGSTQISVAGQYIPAGDERVYLPLVAKLATPATPAAGKLPYVGVSLAGADFGESNLPGTYGTHYTYPTTAEVDYFTGKKMTLFRLPFRWERLQPTLNTAFAAAELARMDTFVSYATGKGAYVLLDPHNYARYYGNVIGEGDTPAVPATAFADFWSRLAEHYQNNPRVLFGLMNEPNSMETEVWVADANAALQAIRATGATNLVLVSGNAWSGAHSWAQNWYGTPNATAMLALVDPGNNYAIEVHQYMDSDSSGSGDTCVSATIGSERMAGFTAWLRQNHLRGFLGEFNGGDNATCNAATDDILTHLEENNDVYLGWAYWAAGPWWGDSLRVIEPIDGQDRPQMAILEPHLP